MIAPELRAADKRRRLAKISYSEAYGQDHNLYDRDAETLADFALSVLAAAPDDTDTVSIERNLLQDLITCAEDRLEDYDARYGRCDVAHTRLAEEIEDAIKKAKEVLA